VGFPIAPNVRDDQPTDAFRHPSQDHASLTADLGQFGFRHKSLKTSLDCLSEQSGNVHAAEDSKWQHRKKQTVTRQIVALPAMNKKNAPGTLERDISNTHRLKSLAKN
jgi:hypothetical protein